MTRRPLFGYDNTRQQRTRLVILLFVVGLALGLTINWNRSQTDGAASSEEEYVALVANLYQRERLLPNAQQRLALLNSPDSVTQVDKIAADFATKYPLRQQTASNLRSFAQVLKENPASQATTANSTTSQNDSGGAGWLPLVIIIIVMAGVGGGVFALRVLPARREAASRTPRYTGAFVNSGQRSSPFQRRRPPADDEDEPLSGIFPSSRPLTKEGVSEPRPMSKEDAAQTVSAPQDWRPMTRPLTTTSETGPVAFTTSSKMVSEPRPYVPPPAEDAAPVVTSAKDNGHRAADHDTSASQESISVIRSRPKFRYNSAINTQTFTCRYRAGDDPYDETHTIIDPTTRVPIGACGISSALTLNESGGQCFGFTLWLQQYGGSDEICSVGLASKWAESSRRGAMRVWISRENLREVVTASDGLSLKIETNGLLAEVRLTRFDYLEDETIPRYACFSHLDTTFIVTLQDRAT